MTHIEIAEKHKTDKPDDLIVFFNGVDATYWGWIYNQNHEIIGDFDSDDSCELETELEKVTGLKIDWD